MLGDAVGEVAVGVRSVESARPLETRKTETLSLPALVTNRKWWSSLSWTEWAEPEAVAGESDRRARALAAGVEIADEGQADRWRPGCT